MANAASRIFKIMQNSGTDTVSEVVYLKVKSTNPLILNLEDRLDITEEFIVLSDSIIKDRIQIGDILTATTFNNGQTYLVSQGLKKDLRRQVVDNLNSTSNIDNLSANQGRILYGYIEELRNTIQQQGEIIANLQQNVTSINSSISSLDSRVTALESKI